MSNVKQAIQNAVLGYIAKESNGAKLRAGVFIVKIVDWLILHSRINWDGSLKTSLPVFIDPTPQLGIMFRDVDTGDVGWHRFNVYGYKRWDDLTDAQQKSDKFEAVIFGSQVYACKQTDKGLVRQKDTKRTAGAESFIDQFMSTIGHTGSSVEVAMKDALDNGLEFEVELEYEDYEGDDTLKVKSFSKVADGSGDFG